MELAPPKKKLVRRNNGGGRYKVPSLQPIREEQGLSREELARLAGVTKPTVWGLEKDRNLARAKTVYQLAEALGVEGLDLVMPLEKEEGETPTK